jgi:hypothetical protein
MRYVLTLVALIAASHPMGPVPEIMHDAELRQLNIEGSFCSSSGITIRTRGHRVRTSTSKRADHFQNVLMLLHELFNRAPSYHFRRAHRVSD